MTYEQLERIELYNNIARFNRDLLTICMKANQYVSGYNYDEDMTNILSKFKEIIPLNIDSLTLKQEYLSYDTLIIHTGDSAIELDMNKEIGFDLYEMEYSMDIFEPGDITNGIILEALLCAKEAKIYDHFFKLSGIKDEELDFLNYDELKSMIERLGQINLYKFDHRIEDDVLIIDFTLDVPKEIMI